MKIIILTYYYYYYYDQYYSNSIIRYSPAEKYRKYSFSFFLVSCFRLCPASSRSLICADLIFPLHIVMVFALHPGPRVCLTLPAARGDTGPVLRRGLICDGKNTLSLALRCKVTDKSVGGNEDAPQRIYILFLRFTSVVILGEES